VRIRNGGRSYLMRTTMSRIARRLDAVGTFVRVRRSALINVRAVANMQRYGRGTYIVHLRSGTKVISSRYHQREIREVMRQFGYLVHPPRQCSAALSRGASSRDCLAHVKPGRDHLLSC
jgi:hypothetical protein